MRWVMGLSVEKTLLAVLVVGAACATALSAETLGDYGAEAAPSLEALARGDLAGFTHASAPYAGSFTLRAPFVALAGLLGGGPLAIYRLGSLPCLLAGAALALVIAQMGATLGRRPLERWIAAGLIVAAPATLALMHMGHPEEVLASALAVGAVLWAPTRPVAAGVLLGLAVASKSWALIAVGPVLLAAAGGRPLLMTAAGAAGVAAFAPFVAGAPQQLLELTTGSTATGHLWGTFQLFYPLGSSHEVWVSGGASGGHFTSSPMKPHALIAGLAHPLIVLASAGLTLLAAARGRRGRVDALALLALCALLRCVLDPWNFGYYILPCVFALAAWELLRGPGLPVLALLALALTWVTFWRVAEFQNREVMWILYLAWVVPLAVVLGRHALRGRARPHTAAHQVELSLSSAVR